jgi:hypothetical protein
MSANVGTAFANVSSWGNAEEQPQSGPLFQTKSEKPVSQTDTSRRSPARLALGVYTQVVSEDDVLRVTNWRVIERNFLSKHAQAAK